MLILFSCHFAVRYYGDFLYHRHKTANKANSISKLADSVLFNSTKSEIVELNVSSN